MVKKKVVCNFRDDSECVLKLAQNYNGVSQKCDGKKCIFQKLLQERTELGTYPSLQKPMRFGKK